MGGSVSSFIGNVAKTVAKGATTALGGMIPVVGPALASGVNSLYAKGGKVMPRFEAGGEVPAGFKAKVINTPAELIRVIKQFPAEASKANLSVQDVKDAVAELKAPAMGRGGEAMMADGGMVMPGGWPYGMYGKNVSAPLPAPYNPGPPGRGQMGMMYGRGGEPAMAMGGCCGMSGQRAPARGRGGF
jgi:hypothetical protein